MKTTVSFLHEVQNWWVRLEAQVKTICHRHKTPVLITLSRKMPRFVDYYISQADDNSFLKNVQVTTEIAIPFVFTKSNVTDLEFIIVDDMIIHGDTLRTVANDLYYLTGKLCHVSCIFIHEDAIIPDSVDVNDLVGLKRSSQNEIEPYINEMSALVEKYQLPIDLEFPIFSSNDFSQWEILINHFTSKEVNIFSLESSRDLHKFTVLLSDIMNEKFNYDFSKIRFFKKEQQIECEVFSPAILSEEDLFQCYTSLFENKLYQNIWYETTERIREKVSELSSINLISSFTLKNAYARSLCVWANYLLSLSCLINLLKSIDLDFFTSSFVLCFHNLSLIIGDELSSTIKEELDSLIEKKETTRILCYKNADMPDSFVPKTFKSKIEIEKAKMLIESHSEEEILKGIFKMQHYTNPILNKPKYRFERLFFGETFESLERAFSPFYSEKEHIVRMHLWIDDMIDRGSIIPKYERLEAGGRYLWRRCFHAGLKKI